jgi:hypothetical protein
MLFERVRPGVALVSPRSKTIVEADPEGPTSPESESCPARGPGGATAALLTAPSTVHISNVLPQRGGQLRVRGLW